MQPKHPMAFAIGCSFLLVQGFIVGTTFVFSRIATYPYALPLFLIFIILNYSMFKIKTLHAYIIMKIAETLQF